VVFFLDRDDWIVVAVVILVACVLAYAFVPRLLAGKPAAAVDTSQQSAPANNEAVVPIAAAPTSRSIIADAPTPTPTPTPTPDPNHPYFQVIAHSRPFAFEPSVLRVKRGQNFTVLVYVWANDTPQGFTLPAFNVSQVVDGGTSARFELQATLPVGEYVFNCAAYCGKGHGEMKGKIVVE